MNNLKLKKSPFQLKLQRIKKVDFKLNDKTDANTAIEINADLNIKKNDDKAIAIVELVIFVNKNNESAKITSTIIAEGLFEWEKGLEDIETYLTTNAPAVLFSQIRTIFSTLTLSAGIPNSNIPLMNFDNKDNSK